MTAEEKGWLANARRTEENGWLHVKIAGEPFARGFQHGYLVAAEFKDAWRVYDAMTLETMGLGLDFFVEKAVAMHKPKIPPEQQTEINAETGQKILGDTFDVYLMRIEPSSRTISAHYDTDPQPYVSDPNAVWNEPYYPAGSVDGKVTTADGAKTMSMWGRFGRADGLEFDAEAFLRIHPQWHWQQGYLKNRPHRPWTYFDGEK